MMDQARNIREGMQVYGANDQLLGTVERVQGDGFEVAGQHYSREMVARVAQNRVYVRGTGMTTDAARMTTGQTDNGRQARGRTGRGDHPQDGDRGAADRPGDAAPR